MILLVLIEDCRTLSKKLYIEERVQLPKMVLIHIYYLYIHLYAYTCILCSGGHVCTFSVFGLLFSIST